MPVAVDGRPAPTPAIVADNWIAGVQRRSADRRRRRGDRATTPTCASAPRASSRRCSTPSSPARSCIRRSIVAARGGGKLSGDGSGIQGGAALDDVGARPLGPRALRPRRAPRRTRCPRAADFEYARQSMAALVAKNWFLATEAGTPGGAGARDDSRGARSWCAWPRRARASASATTRTSTWRARRSAPIATRCGRSSWRATQALRALELLLGRYPAAAAGGRAARFPASRPRFRPDCRRSCSSGVPTSIAAERRVAAAFNRVGEAKAARLPAIALTTGVSAISSELFVLQDHDNPVWNLGANLLAPIFKGGALKTQVEIRTAEQKQAIAGYAVGRPARVRRGRERAGAGDRRARARADPRRRPSPTTSARYDDRADAVQRRQHRPALRHAAPARAERHAVRAHPHAGRAARAARESLPGAGGSY